ncbi:hypothetical protein [Caballeronia sp. LZ032]|nr:hypothetical protein [Caballeronia sp. LZ032]MDR5879052.1 hypothetical protein [Caballeronia sp. LZ032]
MSKRDQVEVCKALTQKKRAQHALSPLNLLVGRTGFEPVTNGLKER